MIRIKSADLDRFVRRDLRATRWNCLRKNSFNCLSRNSFAPQHINYLEHLHISLYYVTYFSQNFTKVCLQEQNKKGCVQGRGSKKIIETNQSYLVNSKTKADSKSDLVNISAFNGCVRVDVCIKLRGLQGCSDNICIC